MSTFLTVQNLIQCFEDGIHKFESENLSDFNGTEPYSPQLIIYLGNDASRAHPILSNSLLLKWPQYQEELKFIGVQSNKELDFMEFPANSTQAKLISIRELQDIATGLFGTRMHFQDRSRLFVYYVLDTSSMCSMQEFSSWVSAISDIKKILGYDSIDILDMLVVFLNENLYHKQVSGDIQNYLSRFYSDNELRDGLGSIMLLSNLRSDHATLEEWDECYRVLASTIVLSNNADAQIAASIFNKSILTARYAHKKKPIDEIGPVVIRSLLGLLENNISQSPDIPLDDPKLPEKLGLTSDGTFATVDQYIESNVWAILPTTEELELFPRRNDSELQEVTQMSAKAFNEFTMGSWKMYLSELRKNAQFDIERDSGIRNRWKEEYSKYLLRSFSKDEILYLSKHIEDLKVLFCKQRIPSEDAPVITYAREYLKYLLSSEAFIAQVFLDAITYQGEMSQRFTQSWNDLLKSRRRAFHVRDSSVESFYMQVVQNYFDHEGIRACEEFSKLHDADELYAFLKKRIHELIDSDDVFVAPFEKELEQRLTATGVPIDTNTYIRKKLTETEAYTYFQANFNLGSPLLSSVLIKTDTSLSDNLRNHLSPSTYFYNTGDGNVAEALSFYEVRAEFLIRDNGGC